VGQSESEQDRRYREAAEEFGPALERLSRAYEFDHDKRRDLLQEIHVALWRSFATFDGRCSLRTWVYRVSHNAAASHVMRQQRVYSRLVSVEDLDVLPDMRSEHEAADREKALEKLLVLIQRLKPLDRQVILAYLEGLDGATIGEITGISPGNAATKIHRIKSLLVRQFHEGERHV
jgi:RNA polymerase sigma-70 factor (ECF subfamily)